MSNNKLKKAGNSGIISMIKGNIGILCVLVLIAIVLSLLTPNFLTRDNLISVLRQISINVFIAIGMTLVIILGGIDLSVGSIVAMSGTVIVGLIVTSGLPVWLAIIIGLALGTACGFFNGAIIAKFKVPAFIVTMAMMNIARGAGFVYSGGRSTRIVSDGFNFIGNGYLFGFLPMPVLYMIILIAVFVIVLNKTKFGTYIYAIGGNRESARLSGVPIKKVEIAVFTICGFLSAFAGLVLCSRMYSGQPSVAEGYELDAIAACVLGGVSMSGGKGRISGTILGAMVIGIINNGLNLMSVSSFWQLVVKGVIILIAVLIDTQKGSDSIIRRIFSRGNSGKPQVEAVAAASGATDKKE